ncbi:MAG: DUF4886 domain-containing protein [Lachnospiraceae bacterium]|nr:DUF4886 domain-containing protein [Lachnospiraceae bacterium]
MVRNFRWRYVLAAMIVAVLFFVPATAGTANAQALPKNKKVSVLLIGNSMVKRSGNDTMKYLKGMAKNAGRNLYLDYVAYGNEKLYNYCNSKNSHGKAAQKKIAQKKWDYIILQENTDWAIAHGNTFLNASIKLCKYIEKKCPTAKILYNCTWAYDKTVWIQGKKYTHSTQQKNMNKKYLQAASATGGSVCWTGNAFDKYRKVKKAKNLYVADKNHASKYGWYLNAASMYAMIFQTSPSECTYTGGLNCSHAKQLRKIAGQVNGFR